MKINNTVTKKQLIFAIISTVVVMSIVIVGVVTKPRKALQQEVPKLVEEPLQEVMELVEEEPLPGFALTLRGAIELIEKQSEIDENILAELHSGAYSFENPLVIVDPYDISPLTALAVFTSEEPLNISIHIEGKTELANVDYTFEGYNTEHQIPIYGLYPGELNLVELTAKTRSGETKNASLEIQTDSLPPALASNIILTDVVHEDKYQPGFNYTFSQKSAFDANGEYRWFYDSSSLYTATLYNYQGNFVVAKGVHFESDLLLYEINTLGKIVRVYNSPYGAHHDITPIPSGDNLLITGSMGETIEDFIYEIDVETGNIVNTLDLKRILQRTRTEGCSSYSTEDWFHNNAIVYDNGSIIISGRNQSTVAKLKWPEGDIEWILSDHDGWNPMFQKYLLTPEGDGFEWQYVQHAPEIMPDYDDNPDTIDVLLFDNGSDRFLLDKEIRRAVASGEIAEPELYSRMVHYRINEKSKTIEQIWQFGKELGENYFATAYSDANILLNGNRLGTFDRINIRDGVKYNANLIEVDADSNIIWEAYATSNDVVGKFYTYRLERLPLYNDAANNLRIGEPARNLIQKEVLEKYGY